MGPCEPDDRFERALSETETGLRLAIRLQPGASANRIEGFETLADALESRERFSLGHLVSGG